MNIILDSSLTSSDESWPSVQPVSFITFEVLRLARALLKPVGKLNCFISWSALDRLKSQAEPEMLEWYSRCYDFVVCENVPRHDWIEGAWVERLEFTPIHANAAYEDATILEKAEDGAEKVNGCVIRFRRVLSFSEAAQLCWDVEETSPPTSAKPHP